MRSASMLMLVLFLLGCGKSETGGSPGNNASGDPRLEGSFTRVSDEMNGVVIKESETAQVYTFSGNIMIPPKGKEEDGLKFQCDPSKNPAQITFTKTEASGKVDTFYGIYKLEDDTLTICMVKSDNPAIRPSEFKTSKGSSVAIWVLKKVK